MDDKGGSRRMYDHRYTPTFQDCVQRYRQRADIQAALYQALSELARQPFGNPKLQTHAVKRAQPGTYTSYVTNQGHRLIWRQVGNVVVLLLFGEHDAVYRRAERLRLEIDDRQNVLRVIDEDPATGARVPYAERRVDEGRLFMAWNDDELRAFGFTEREVTLLRKLNTDDDLLNFDGRIRPEAWQLAMNLTMYGTPEPTPVPDIEPAEQAVETPTPVEDEREAAALRDPRSSPEFVPVPADRLAELLSRPIEDWMVYLDPTQEELVNRSFTGPARIRGAAGTGKTVVALHRARMLARLGRRVLFTTYVRNLPEVYKQVFSRFAPAEAGQVDFSNVHRWAIHYLHRHDIHPKIDMREVNKAWSAAFAAVVTPGSPIKRANLTPAYLKEEVEWVVRGRALPDLDAYLALERNGRGTPLSRDQRTQTWQLAERYATELADRGVWDFSDVLVKATDAVQASGTAEYDAVIIDEAQDLTEAALRLLYALVGDSSNGLLLVGDGQQSIYPGGFNLTALGLQVRGRSVVLNHNYRNTRQVFQTAQAVVAGHSFDDGGERPEPGARTVEVTRTGPDPTIVAMAAEDDHDLALAEAIEAAIQNGSNLGDLAVLVPRQSEAEHYLELIERLGLPAQHLKDYDGKPNGLVKVGTYQRAKGLEFKLVYLPRLDADGLREAQRPDEDDESHRERLALLRRQLFVAMTRARDGLWLGYVGTPSVLLPDSLRDSSAAQPSAG
jgi:superfamily I DNA/RNA helicase